MNSETATNIAKDFRISDLCSILESYLEESQVAEVYRAYLLGADAHQGQTRMTGEPYIFHPVAVARILAEMHMDYRSIVAAILHDVIEDTGITKEELAEAFDEEVAELVDGVTKLTQIKFKSPAEAQAENFRKMMLAMVRDIRVIMVKLADRLHNMRTLGVMRPEKRRRIARETLDIYVPIALRLGMNTIRHELEDLGFAAFHPMRYRVLAEAVKRSRGNRKEIMQTIETALVTRLEEEGVQARVFGREKHLYSIFMKMRNKGLTFNEVLDVYAFRIVVDSVDSCYRTLGVVHNLYKPVPGKFKDYIAIPKANGYQSLHTIMHGPFDLPIEAQIRTADMDKVAEAGIAAHWLYKAGDEGSSSTHTRAREWLRSLLEMQKTAGDSMEFLENVKIDLFPDEVYVFTPQGEILVLPRGSTPVDFAYAVHTDVGNACVAAKIDRRLAPLRTPLHNGQTVEVITSPVTRPNPTWLNFVVTAKARTSIRNYLKNLQREEAIKLGRHMLEKSLTSFGYSLDAYPPEKLVQVVNELGFDEIDDLCEAVGFGQHMAQLVAKRMVDNIADGQEPEKVAIENGAPLIIRDTQGMLVNFARCCRPIPGDAILGFVSAGRGIVIHVDSCKNVAEYRDMPEKWIDVGWEGSINADFPVEIRVDSNNQRGVLAIIAAEIAEAGSNIDNINMEHRDGVHSTINFTVSVHDRRHLARIMRRIRATKQVLRISRVKS